jgi:hypothetical protein
MGKGDQVISGLVVQSPNYLKRRIVKDSKISLGKKTHLPR